MSRPAVPVGFDYSQAVLELRAVVSYERIAEYCGYESKSAIGEIAKSGRIPTHPAGEALYALYVEIFAKKPPMNVLQAAGSTETFPQMFRKQNGKPSP